MTTKSLRKEFGYTQKELAEKYDIPLRTLQNWDARDCMPDYVFMMMYRIERLEARNLELKNCIYNNLAWGVELFDVPVDNY